ncbi:MAG: HD domain-containing protein [Clostridia bacterium]|nr:HD domain-containing protein [Clostridia bacterium]
MYYAIIDLEWNQYHNPLWTPESRSGVIMHEEIIQIGAVKTDESMTPVDTFNLYVRLGGRRRLDRYVKKLTGIGESQIASGEDFPVAADMFAAWLADVDAIFSWGQDDRRVFLNNLAFHSLNAPACAWYDAQRIYAAQRPEHGPLALKHVAEAEGVRVNLSLHDAMNDAVLTSVCMKGLDIAKGIEEYDHVKNPPAPGMLRPISTARTHRHPSQQAAWEEAVASLMHCPRCMQALTLKEGEKGTLERWYKYAECPDHGEFILRGEFMGVKFKTLKLSFYEATEEARAAAEKEAAPASAPARKRSRRHRGGKKNKDAVQALTPEELLARAVAFAAESHKEQLLLPGASPYIVHPMEASSIAATMTDDSAVLAAAVLHDVPAMCPGVSMDQMRSLFGDHVCGLIESARAGSEDLQAGRAPEGLSNEELIVMLSDALSSLRALSRNVRLAGDKFWEGMAPEARAQTAAHFKGFLKVFSPLKTGAAFQEFRRLISATFASKAEDKKAK